MKKLLIVTACLADNDSQIFRLQESCKKYDLPFKYYGIKTVWRNYKQGKIDLLVDFLREAGLGYEHILFTDGFDSWMLGEQDAILWKFRSIGGDIVISAEKDCYPFTEWVDKFPESQTAFRYPCAGQFMGKTDKLIEALSYMSARFRESVGRNSDDQAIWHTIFLEDRFNIKPDYFCRLFLPMNSVTDDEVALSPEKILFAPTECFPMSIHFNGPKNEKSVERMDRWYRKTIPS